MDVKKVDALAPYAENIERGALHSWIKTPAAGEREAVAAAIGETVLWACSSCVIRAYRKAWALLQEARKREDVSRETSKPQKKETRGRKPKFDIHAEDSSKAH